MRGLERGLARAIGREPRVAAYVEIEAFCAFNLVAQMEAGVVDPAPVWTDLKTFPADPFHGKVDGIIGGYPCQGESYAGLRQLENDPRFLWPAVSRSMRAINPVFGFFENVAGHLSGTFSYVLKDLRRMGYHVEAGIYTAAEVGAPHIRNRVFILAVSDRRRLGDYLPDTNGFISGLPTTNKRHQNNGIEDRGKNVVDSKGKGLQKLSDGGQKTELSGPSIPSGRWPTKPGKGQHDWERPRTIKPGVGCTVDGYNFRTDLLRLYGNGVVE